MEPLDFIWLLAALRFNCTAAVRAYFQSQPKQLDDLHRWRPHKDGWFILPATGALMKLSDDIEVILPDSFRVSELDDELTNCAFDLE